MQALQLPRFKDLFLKSRSADSGTRMFRSRFSLLKSFFASENSPVTHCGKLVCLIKTFVEVENLTSLSSYAVQIKDSETYGFRQNSEFSNTFLQLSHLQHCQKNSDNQSAVGLTLNKLNLQQENQLKPVLDDKEIRLLLLSTAAGTIKITDDDVKRIDEECCRHVSKWTLQFCLYVQDALYLSVGHRALNTKYFKTLLSLWTFQLKFASKYDFIHIVFLLGLRKSIPAHLESQILKKLETFAETLTFDEWTVICRSIFKARLKSTSPLVLQKLVANSMIALSHNVKRSDIIARLKVLRLSECYDEDFYKTLAKYIGQSCFSYNVVECSHFISAFANVGFYDTSLYEQIEKQVMQSLLQEQDSLSRLPPGQLPKRLHPSVRSRTKDIARILWSFASVGHTPSANFCALIINAVEMKFKEEGYDKAEKLLDCIHSLVILGQYPENILDIALTNRFANEVNKIRKHKPMNQFKFVAASVTIERPNYEQKINEDLLQSQTWVQKSLYKEIKSRKGFEVLLDMLAHVLPKGMQYQVKYILPHISFASVEIRAENSVLPKASIELIDSTVKLRNQDRLCGLMQTRLRQLQLLKYYVVMMTTEQVFEIHALPENMKKAQINELIFSGWDKMCHQER